MFLHILPFFLLFAFATVIPLTQAQSPEELQSRIEQNNNEIEKLRQEIINLQNDLNTTSTQKQTLQSAVKAIDLNIQKLPKSISLTQVHIQQKDAEIRTPSGDISDATGNIGSARAQIAGSLRELQVIDSQPLVLTLLAGGSLSSMFDDIDTIKAPRSQLQNHIEDLSNLRSGLEVDKTDAEGKRRELATLTQTLSREKQGLAIARNEQNKLLEETKNKESN